MKHAIHHVCHLEIDTFWQMRPVQCCKSMMEMADTNTIRCVIAQGVKLFDSQVVVFLNELINLRDDFGSHLLLDPDLGSFKGFFNIVRYVIFPQFDSYVWKIDYIMAVSLDKEVASRFWKSSGSQIRCRLRIGLDSFWKRSALPKCSCLYLL